MAYFQLVEHCSATAEAMSSNPVEVPKFFWLFFSVQYVDLHTVKKINKWNLIIFINYFINLIIEGIFAIRINDRSIGPMRCFC